MPHPDADPSAPPRNPYPGDASFRLAGRHRGDGLAGPPRRYLAFVALLAGAASMPLIAAVITGPGGSGRSALGDVSPFLAPPSGGPVIVPMPPAPGLGDQGAVVPGGAQLPVVRLPAVLSATGSDVAPVRLRVSTGPRPAVPVDPDGGAGSAPARQAEPNDQRDGAAPTPDPAPKSTTDRAARGRPDQSGPGTKADRHGPGTDRDAPAASAPGARGRPPEHATRASRG